MDTKLWAVLIPPMDDVFASASEADARQLAERHNKAIEAAGLAEQFGMTKEQISAQVIEWPHSAESHAEALASGEAG